MEACGQKLLLSRGARTWSERGVDREFTMGDTGIVGRDAGGFRVQAAEAIEPTPRTLGNKGGPDWLGCHMHSQQEA